MGKIILQMRNITKRFHGVVALDHVHLNVREGEVMALLGENGAGKSTLMKILTGVYQRDDGTILLNEKEVHFSNARQAQEAGIAIIHQELNLVPKMTVYENVFLGREARNKFGALDRKYMIQKTKELLQTVNVDLNPIENIETLSIAQQQMVEIAKALLLDAKVIVMDEPTDALPEEEVASLFKILQQLKAQNKGIVYISHRLKEVFEICDRATVLRDGAFIKECKVSELTQESLIKMMVGRSLDDQFPHIDKKPEEVVLSVQGLSNSLIHNISFELRAGEILGVAGLVGAGRTELAQTLFGCHDWEKGKVFLHDKEIRFKSPYQAISNGVFYTTEDRKRNGVVLVLDVLSNMTISALRRFSKMGRLRLREEREAVKEYKDKINIKMASFSQQIKFLSGGNQQKVVISKALMTEPDVLLLDEPTRGIDVGAKKEIYHLINQLKERGKAIIMISSEMPEILGMSDRILVMHEGTVKATLSREEATQEIIMEKIIS